MTTCDGDVRITEAVAAGRAGAAGDPGFGREGAVRLRTSAWRVLGRQIFPGAAEEVRRARAFTETALRTSADLWSGFSAVAEERIEVATLLASELVSNAIRHTRSGYPGGVVRLEIRRCTDVLVVEVRDQGPAPGTHPGAPTVRCPSFELTSGRGMALVDSLSARWDVFRVGAGHTVWFELPAAAERAD